MNGSQNPFEPEAAWLERKRQTILRELDELKDAPRKDPVRTIDVGRTAERQVAVGSASDVRRLRTAPPNRGIEGMVPMIAERLRQNFEAAGHRVSPRDDVSEAAVAWLLGTTVGTMRNRRGQRRAPPHRKLPCGICYPIDNLAAWLVDQVESGNESRLTELHDSARLTNSRE